MGGSSSSTTKTTEKTTNVEDYRTGAQEGATAIGGGADVADFIGQGESTLNVQQVPDNLANLLGTTFEYAGRLTDRVVHEAGQVAQARQEGENIEQTTETVFDRLTQNPWLVLVPSAVIGILAYTTYKR